MHEIVITVLNEDIAELCAINIEKKTNYHCEIRKTKSDWNTKVQSLIDFIDTEFPHGCEDIECKNCALFYSDDNNLCDHIQGIQK